MIAFSWIVSGCTVIWLTAVAGIVAFIHVAGLQDHVFVARFHLLVLGSALLVVLFLEGVIVYACKQGKNSRSFALISGCSLGAAHALLVAYYGALIFGLRSWGDVITQDLLFGFAREVPFLLSNMPFSVFPAIVAGIIVGLLLVACHVGLAVRRIRAWQTVFEEHASPPRLLKVSLFGLTTAVCLVFINWAVFSDRAVFASEPIASLILNQTWRDQVGAARNALYDEQEHELARANYGSPKPSAAPHVVLIVLDAARPDRMSAYGWPRPTTPFLDSVVKSGKAAAVSHAYSTCANTACAVGSLLQSQTANRLVRNGFGLPDVLQAAGYRTVFVLTGNHTGFFSLRKYYGRSPDVFVDGTGRNVIEISDDEATFSTLQTLDLDSGHPTFLMIHLMSSHVGGRKYSAFQRYIPNQARITDPIETKKTAFANNHDNGLLQADDYVRRIFSLLETKGVLSNAVVFIVADHGESIGEKGIFMHAQSVYEPEIRIPMFILDNQQSRYQRNSNVSIMDVAPTVLDRLGLPIPALWKGESLLRESSRKWTMHQMGLYAALIEWGKEGAGLKLVYHTRDRYAELYNLRVDPREEFNLFQDRRQDSARLILQLSLEQGMVRPRDPITSSAADEIWKKLIVPGLRGGFTD